MIRLIEEGTISGKMAKEIVEDMYKTGKSPQTIIEEKGMVQITDEGELVKTITSIMKPIPISLRIIAAARKNFLAFLSVRQ